MTMKKEQITTTETITAKTTKMTTTTKTIIDSIIKRQRQ